MLLHGNQHFIAYPALKKGKVKSLLTKPSLSTLALTATKLQGEA